MGKANLLVNGRRYALGCDDGEEDRLVRLGEQLDARIRTLADQFGQIGDQRLLLMAGIMLLDEFEELRENIEARADIRVADVRRDAERAMREATKAAKVSEDGDRLAAETLSRAADRIERMADMLGGS